jgi:hypothetical protein
MSKWCLLLTLTLISSGCLASRNEEARHVTDNVPLAPIYDDLSDIGGQISRGANNAFDTPPTHMTPIRVHGGLGP